MVVGSSIDKVYMVMDFGGMDLKVRIWCIIVTSTRVAINHSFTNILLIYRYTTLIYRCTTHLPIQIITHLPIQIITHLPIQIITHLPIQVITHLPIQVITHLPIQIITHLPIQLITH